MNVIGDGLQTAIIDLLAIHCSDRLIGVPHDAVDRHLVTAGAADRGEHVTQCVEA